MRIERNQGLEMRDQQNSGSEINILELLRLLWHNAWIIAIATGVLGLAALFYSAFVITPQYTSTTSMYVMSSSQSLTYQDTQLSMQIMRDYKEIITSRSVLEETIARTGIETNAENLKKKIKLSNTENTRVITIAVKDPSPEVAQLIAETVRTVSAEKIQQILDVDAVNTVDKADLPDRKSSPSITRWTLAGALIGFVISALVLIILYLTNTTIKSAEDVERYLGLSTLATIPVHESDKAAGKGKKSLLNKLRKAK